jgi:hypothetical protein
MMNHSFLNTRFYFKQSYSGHFEQEHHIDNLVFKKISNKQIGVSEIKTIKDDDNFFSNNANFMLIFIYIIFKKALLEFFFLNLSAKSRT